MKWSYLNLNKYNVTNSCMKTTGLNWITEILKQKSLSILGNVYVMRFVLHKTLYLSSETEVTG